MMHKHKPANISRILQALRRSRVYIGKGIVGLNIFFRILWPSFFSHLSRDVCLEKIYNGTLRHICFTIPLVIISYSIALHLLFPQDFPLLNLQFVWLVWDWKTRTFPIHL